jgi:hypothetical protein
MRPSRESACTAASSRVLPVCSRWRSRSGLGVKYVGIASLPRLRMIRISSKPAATASSTTKWITGRSPSGSISFGTALASGRKRVPKPAAGRMAFIGESAPYLMPSVAASAGNIGA